MSSSLGFRNQWTNPLVAFRASEHSLPILQSGRGLIVSRPICYNVKALKSAPNSDTVVAADNSYGRKEVISVNPRLYDYLLANVREPKILRELREETATMHGSQMQVSPDQAQLLAMLVQILGAEKCIEVGVYTGYSSLAVALVLPEGGQLVACERDAKSLEVAQRYYDHAGVSKKVCCCTTLFVASGAAAHPSSVLPCHSLSLSVPPSLSRFCLSIYNIQT